MQTAKLSVVLKADDIVVVESDDALLWQKTFSTIIGGSLQQPQTESSEEEKTPVKHDTNDAAEPENKPESTKNRIECLAKEFGVSAQLLIGAFDPRPQPPYITCNRHNFEFSRKKMPTKGRGAVSPIAIVATILTLWKEQLSLAPATIKDCLPILNDLGLKCSNPKRSLNNCHWLFFRKSEIIVNPAEISQAYAVLNAFILKKTPEYLKE